MIESIWMAVLSLLGVLAWLLLAIGVAVLVLVLLLFVVFGVKGIYSAVKEALER